MDDKAIYYIDRCLPLFPSYEAFRLGEFIFNNLKEKERRDLNNRLQTLVTEIMVEDLNYASVYQKDFTIKLTNKGRKAKRLGGHFKYNDELNRIIKLKEDQIKSVIDTNNSVLETNKIQKKILYLTAILSFLTLVVPQ